ncbi:MAG: glycerol-3-phosphate dehydrogenase [Gemmatimonadales bacterium]
MSPWARATLTDLGSGRHDLLVIGGGITGAGIARDAALRGLGVALVEAGDFGSGTSSRSSRLIHGGLRYLEARQFSLVRESLRERGHLLRLAPHLVRPIEFILPFYHGDRVPRWKVRLGLALYDRLAGTGNVRRHENLSKREVQEQEPLLKDRGLTGAARYFDAQCDDARLTVAVIRAAAKAGAKVANYVRATELVRDGGRVVGVRLRDELTGEETEVSARVVINAAGPWVDSVRRMEDPTAKPLLRLTRGSHVQVAQSRIGNHHAILFTSPIDRRPMFVLPWGNWTYIGTTETDTSDPPEQVRVEQEEIVYLLRSANWLFPKAHLGLEDVTASWAGVRPLVAADPHTPAPRVPRDHRIVRGPYGMLTVAGGKLTTFRLVAERVVDRASEELGIPAPREYPGREEQLPGAAGGIGLALRAPGANLSLPNETVDYLIRHYGAETSVIYALCSERPELREPLHESHPSIAAQVVFALEREFARTAEDILERRVRLSTETSDRGASAKAKITDLVSGYFSGDEAIPGSQRLRDR